MEYLTCSRQYNICRRMYTLFAANSLQSKSLYTYCAKSYSESKYSSLIQSCQPPNPSALSFNVELGRLLTMLCLLDLGRRTFVLRSEIDERPQDVVDILVCGALRRDNIIEFY